MSIYHIYLSNYLSCISIYPSIYLSHLSIYLLSIMYIFLYLSIYLSYLFICLSIFLFIQQSILTVIPLPYLSSNDAHSFILLALPQLLSSYDGEIVDGGGLLKCIEQLLGMIYIYTYMYSLYDN